MGVSSAELTLYGAVSQSVVESMLLGALKRSEADIALAITGIAGPQGGSDEKPVGTVWIACGSLDRHVSREHHFDGGRTQVRMQTVDAALAMAVNWFDHM